MTLIFWAAFGAVAAYFSDSPITWCVIAFVYICFICMRFDKLQESLVEHIDYKIDRLELMIGRRIDDK